MNTYIEEKRFKIRIVHVISLILVLALLFIIYGLTMTNYKYHRRIFGNKYTFTTIEKRNMSDDFNSFLNIALDSELKIDEEYASRINTKKLNSTFNSILDTYLEYLPDDVGFTKGELTRGNDMIIRGDEYGFQIKGEDLQDMIIEVLTLIKDDNNFYYLSKALNSYALLEKINEISSPIEFKDYLNEKIEEYREADFVRNNYQWYQTNFVNDKGKIFLRLLVFSKMEEGAGKTMLFYDGGYYGEYSNFNYNISFRGGEEDIRISGDYSISKKKTSGTGKVYREGEYKTDFVFRFRTLYILSKIEVEISYVHLLAEIDTI